MQFKHLCLLSDAELREIGEEYNFNLEKLAKIDFSTRENVRQLLNRRFGNKRITEWRARSRERENSKRIAETRFNHILSLASQAVKPKKSYTKMYDSLVGYMGTVGEYFSEKMYSDYGISVPLEQAKKFIYNQLTMYRANSYNRSVANSSGQYLYPDYWMVLTPLQFAVMFTNNPDINRLNTFLGGLTNPVGESGSIKDLSRYDHQMGKSITNCAFQAQKLNRSEAKTRGHLEKQILNQLAWRTQMIELSRANPEGFKKAYVLAKSEAFMDVGQQYFDFLLSKPNADFSPLDCIALVRFRSKKNQFCKFKSRNFDLGRLDHNRGYSIDNVGIQNVAANRTEARVRQNLRSYIDKNLSVLSALLASDIELRKAEYSAGLLAWMHQAQHHKAIEDSSAFEVIANKVARLNSQNFEELSQEQKFEIKNHIAFKEGVTKFFDPRVPSLDPYGQLTVQGLLMPAMSIQDHFIDQHGTTFAEAVARKIINALKVHHYASAEKVRQFLPMVVKGLEDEEGASPIIDVIQTQLATKTKRYSVVEVL